MLTVIAWMARIAMLFIAHLRALAVRPVDYSKPELFVIFHEFFCPRPKTRINTPTQQPILEDMDICT